MSTSDDEFEVVWHGALVDDLGTKGGLCKGYVPSTWRWTVDAVIKGEPVEEPCLTSPGSDENAPLPNGSA